MITQLPRKLESTTPSKEMHIEASFEGIDFIMSSVESPVVHSSFKGGCGQIINLY